MKKLTAGIFTVLMGLVSVNAADAAVASKGYVDKLDRVQGALVATNTENIAKNTGDIATLNGGDTVEGSVKKQIKDATDTITSGYQTADTALSERIEQLSGGGATKDELSAAIAAEVTRSNKYTDDAVAAEVTRSNKYTDDAVAAEVTRADQAYDVNGAAATAQLAAEATAKSYTDTEIAKITSTETGILKQAKDYTDTLADGAVATNTDAIATNKAAISENAAAILSINDGTTGVLVTAKKYADDKDTEQTTAITTAYKEADAAALQTAQGYANAAESAAKTYTDQKVAGLNLAEISRVPAACGTPGNYCTLTTNGTNFVWEVIARGDAADEEAPSTDAGSNRYQVTVPGVTEPAVTQ